jgi:hypothetical protein
MFANRNGIVLVLVVVVVGVVGSILFRNTMRESSANPEGLANYLKSHSLIRLGNDAVAVPRWADLNSDSLTECLAFRPAIAGTGYRSGDTIAVTELLISTIQKKKVRELLWLSPDSLVGSEKRALTAIEKPRFGYRVWFDLVEPPTVRLTLRDSAGNAASAELGLRWNRTENRFEVAE